MTEKRKGTQCFFRFPEDKLKSFDRCISRLGYKSRAEIFTAFATYLLEEEIEKENELIFTAAKNLRGNQTNKQNLSELQIKRKLRELIGTMLKPVIAVRGVETAYTVGCEDIRSDFYEKYGLILTDDEIRDGFYQYDLLNKSTLRQYQLERLHPKEETTHDLKNN